MKKASFKRLRRLFSVNTVFALAAGFTVLQLSVLPAVSAEESTQIISENLLRTELQKLIASDGGAENFFGESIAVDGDTAIIGAGSANNDRGAAYIFVRNGNTWTQQAKITAADGASDDSFGSSVAIDGDTVIVGAENDQIEGNGLQGSAYVFTRSGTSWTQQAKLTAPDGALGDTFGNSVAIDGDTSVIGARGDDIGSNNGQGSAYVFVRNGAAWSQQIKLTSGDPNNSDLTGDGFGGSVSISNNTIIVGVGFDGVGANEYQGSAYIYIRSGTSWSQQTRLIAADGAGGDGFGRSVSISGDSVIIASLSDDINANANQGSAYIYTRASAVWTQQAKLTADDGAAQDFFGIDVSIDGDAAVVSSTQAAVNGTPGQGAAYLFSRNGAAWTQAEKFTASDGASGDSFGIEVSISGGYTIVGASSDDIGNNNQGSAYVFENSSNMVNLHTPFDFDGDGKSDLSVFRSNDQIWYIKRSSDSQFSGAQFGLPSDKLAPADFDGDGRVDIAVWREAGQSTFYILQSSDGTLRQDDFGIAGDDPRVVGDWDGDGKADPAVYRAGAQSTFYYRGTNNNPNGSITFLPWGIVGDKPVAGDFDGDGRFDLAVFRPSSGVWYINQSSDGAVRSVKWGISTDRLVPADYDGDGKTDMAVFRDGVWYILQSSASGQPRYASFGLATDQLVPADYDGDGKADVAVFRDGVWYILQSTNGNAAINNFGLAGDQAIPGAFVN